MIDMGNYFLQLIWILKHRIMSKYNYERGNKTIRTPIIDHKHDQLLAETISQSNVSLCCLYIEYQ